MRTGREQGGIITLRAGRRSPGTGSRGRLQTMFVVVCFYSCERSTGTSWCGAERSARVWTTPIRRNRARAMMCAARWCREKEREGPTGDVAFGLAHVHHPGVAKLDDCKHKIPRDVFAAFGGARRGDMHAVRARASGIQRGGGWSRVPRRSKARWKLWNIMGGEAGRRRRRRGAG